MWFGNIYFDEVTGNVDDDCLTAEEIEQEYRDRADYYEDYEFSKCGERDDPEEN